MPQAKQTSKRKRRSKALPVLGAAGLSLSLASAASAVPSGLGDMPTPKTGDDNRVTLGEEDISLAPFYAFDKESEGTGVTLGEEEISDVSAFRPHDQIFDNRGSLPTRYWCRKAPLQHLPQPPRSRKRLHHG